MAFAEDNRQPYFAWQPSNDVEGEGRLATGDLLSTNSTTGSLTLTSAFGGGTISSAGGLDIFFDKVGGMGTIPTVFAQFVHKFKARPAVILYFHMQPLSRPTVPPEESYVVSRTSVPSCYRVVLRHVYMDDVLTPDLRRVLVEQLVLHITKDRTAGSPNGSARAHED
ncbi:hypothetical protein B0T14DRAFT_569002 [Immersiella caudata]|uniref:K+ potassium transporter C-terminal domain-containing protein n=1 Tax=Immersiella caudata TaxID=314043 RepID=A0AA40BXS1_9PEZI|nr:hypothetical protein B0T14DRAFT_569002 [Immersiella caudata]